jgi:hypothetical protein
MFIFNIKLLNVRLLPSRIHKTNSELECVILTTLYLAGAKNTDS